MIENYDICYCLRTSVSKICSRYALHDYSSLQAATKYIHTCIPFIIR